MALLKNSIHTVKIENYASSGEGVARIDGQVVFVKGALVGEECEIKILKAKKNLAYGKMERILHRSPYRQEPACPWFGRCGGCDFLHMQYEAELHMKKARVEETLRRVGGCDIGVSEIIGAEQTEHYRNKAIYAVGQANGRTVTGFYRARSHDVIPGDGCIIQAEYADRAVQAVRTWMDAYHICPYDEKTGEGTVRHVFCRYGFASGMGQVTVVSAIDDLPEKDRLIEMVRNVCPETESIILNVNKTRGNTVLAGTFLTLWGRDDIEDELCALRFKLSPRSFYQVNRAQAEKLYKEAMTFAGLTGGELVLDLYCGTGTITLCLARNAGKVVGAEIVESAIADAKQNAQRNGVENVEFICADASATAVKLRQNGLQPDVIVVDPPRKGLTETVIQAVSEMEPQRIVYISCDPATLARDLDAFRKHGYHAMKVSAVDMFPRCAHVETVVLLSKRKPDTPIEIAPDSDGQAGTCTKG